MSKRWRAGLLLLALSLGSIATASATAQSAVRTLLVVGDSLSAAYGMPTDQGYVALLGARLAEQGSDLRVINASISGDITANGRARLPTLLEEHQPAVVVIELGGNDGLRGLSLVAMRDNLAAMVEAAKAQGAAVLLVGIELPPNYGKTYLEKFRGVYRDVAAEYDIPLVPFLLDGVATRAQYMQADGIHPTAAAQPLMLETLWAKLSPLLEGLETAAR